MVRSAGTGLPLLEFGYLRFSVPQTETLACSLGHPKRNKPAHEMKKWPLVLLGLNISGKQLINAYKSSELKSGIF